MKRNTYFDNMQENWLHHVAAGRAFFKNAMGKSDRMTERRTAWINILRKTAKRSVPRGPAYGKMDDMNFASSLYQKSHGKAKDVFVIGNGGKPKNVYVQYS